MEDCKVYEIKLNGVLAGRANTRKGAYALVTEKFHGKTGVTIERYAVIIWKSE